MRDVRLPSIGQPASWSGQEEDLSGNGLTHLEISGRERGRIVDISCQPALPRQLCQQGWAAHGVGRRNEDYIFIFPGQGLLLYFG